MFTLIDKRRKNHQRKKRKEDLRDKRNQDSAEKPSDRERTCSVRCCRHKEEKTGKVHLGFGIGSFLVVVIKAETDVSHTFIQIYTIQRSSNRMAWKAIITNYFLKEV